jgi:SAM-dependent methyltransferase
MHNPFEYAPLQERPTRETFVESCYLDANPDVAAAVRARRVASGFAHFLKHGMTEGRRQTTPMDEAVDPATFDENRYLAANPDVARAVAAGEFSCGRDHFARLGQREGRRQLRRVQIPDLRARKLALLRERLLDPEAPRDAGGKYCFLDAETRERESLDDEIPVSENEYDAETIGLIESCADGLVLDVGAGLRSVYYSNVVNLEVKDYVTTDVMATADRLPFKDNSFDGVISIAVLEHVRDPFRCAREIARVLKPGGWLKCCVPFLQPLHGYPHHYFNMTHEGLRVLFEPWLAIERQEVTGATHPIWAISWQLRVWADSLPPASRKAFLKTRVEDLIRFPIPMLEKPWARDMPMQTRFELAAATVLFARKPPSPPT